MLIRRDQRGFLTCRLQGNFVRRPRMWRNAERAVVVAHRGGAVGHDDFGVADGRRVFPVHAKAKRTARRLVRSVQSAKPRPTTCATFPPRFQGDLAALVLRAWLVVAGGKPVPWFPRVRHFVERVLIPAKLEYPPFAWCESEQTKRRHVLLRQRHDGDAQFLYTRCGKQRRHDDAAAHATDARFTRYRIPVDQREREAGIIHTYPRAAGGLRGVERQASRSGEAIRWMRRRTLQRFVAVHPDVKAARMRKEGDRTHQSAWG